VCGIIGITNIDNVVEELYMGLIRLQHRGQDACGIHTFDGRKVNVRKGKGYVKDVFKDVDCFRRLVGRSGIGHVRYATVGEGTDEDIQPFYESLFFLASMAHNGNLTNFSELKERYGTIASGCDLEAILKVAHTHAVAKSVAHEDTSRITLPERIDTSSDVALDIVLDSVKKVMDTCEGSFSVISNIAGLGMMGFKDPYGIKPLAVAKKSTPKGTAYCFASEDVVFQMPLDYDFIKEIGPGSVFLVTDDGKVIEQNLVKKQYVPNFCSFELIYFASSVSKIDGVSVSEYRYQLGKRLGKSFNETNSLPINDFICSHIPSAPKRGAAGFSESTGIPEREVFLRNTYVGRGFILPDRKSREDNAAMKLAIDFSVLEDAKYVVLIDDSIVRGDTSSIIVDRLRKECRKMGLPLEKILLGVLAPPNAFPCVYGIDMPVDKEMIYAKEGSVEGVKKYIGVDHLFYNGPQVIHDVLSKLKDGKQSAMCDACFSGNYPTCISHEEIERLKEERLAEKGSEY